MKRLNTGRGYILAERVVDSVPINPKLPPNFDDTPNDERPDSHRKFWHVPFIVTDSVDALDAFYAERTDQWAEEGRQHWSEQGRAHWMEAWPTGVRYTVRCLDGGAWDRSTCWGSFPSLGAALASLGRGES
jgi:hypothetical protein